MPVDLEWSHRARADLLDIYVTIGLERPLAAEHWFDRLEARADVLRHQPRMGARRPDIGDGVRVLVQWPFLILYEAVPDEGSQLVERVVIVRVVDGRRSLTDLLDPQG